MLVGQASLGYSFSPFTSAADRKSTRLNSSHLGISYAVFCLKKKNRLFLAGKRDLGMQFHAGDLHLDILVLLHVTDRFVGVFVHDELLFVFFFNDTATTEIYTLSLHDALPI